MSQFAIIKDCFDWRWKRIARIVLALHNTQENAKEHMRKLAKRETQSFVDFKVVDVTAKEN